MRLLIGLFGEGVVHWPTIFSLTVFPVIVMAYTLLARHEEKQVLEQFEDEYRAYRHAILCRKNARRDRRL